MKTVRFEWDEKKDKQNQERHGVPFELAQYAFTDPSRVIAEDLSHSGKAKRYYCFGRVGDGIMTVRFTIDYHTIPMAPTIEYSRKAAKG